MIYNGDKDCHRWSWMIVKLTDKQPVLMKVYDREVDVEDSILKLVKYFPVFSAKISIRWGRFPPWLQTRVLVMTLT